MTGVDISVDGGNEWAPADVEPPRDRWSWARWTWTWEAAVGSYQLSARAHDASGRSQPVEPAWNRGGFSNNLVQRVPVVVLR